MGFRFRKSVGFGVGRLNLSKSGASLSVGGRGNVVTLGRRGVRHTVGIPGTGLSYSHKLGGGGRSRREDDDSNFGLDVFPELLDQATASTEVQRATLHVAEIKLASLEKLRGQMDEE